MYSVLMIQSHIKVNYIHTFEFPCDLASILILIQLHWKVNYISLFKSHCLSPRAQISAYMRHLSRRCRMHKGWSGAHTCHACAIYPGNSESTRAGVLRILVHICMYIRVPSTHPIQKSLGLECSA